VVPIGVYDPIVKTYLPTPFEHQGSLFLLLLPLLRMCIGVSKYMPLFLESYGHQQGIWDNAESVVSDSSPSSIWPVDDSTGVS